MESSGVNMKTYLICDFDDKEFDNVSAAEIESYDFDCARMNTGDLISIFHGSKNASTSSFDDPFIITESMVTFDFVNSEPTCAQYLTIKPNWKTTKIKKNRNHNNKKAE